MKGKIIVISIFVFLSVFLLIQPVDVRAHCDGLETSGARPGACDTRS